MFESKWNPFDWTGVVRLLDFPIFGVPGSFFLFLLVKRAYSGRLVLCFHERRIILDLALFIIRQHIVNIHNAINIPKRYI